MKRRLGGALFCASMLAAVLGVSVPNASAQTAAGPADPAAPADMVAALMRDLHLTADQATTRLAKEDAATRVEEELRAELGAGFGGAWLAPDDQQLIVAITDPDLAALVRAKGAEPRLVTRSTIRLDALMAQLDRVPAPSTVSSWYVDTPTNTVVIQVDPGGSAVAKEFVRAAGVDPTTVRIETTASRPVLSYDVRGGDPYGRGQYCSVGFSVVGGFVTAGHCDRAGAEVWGPITNGLTRMGEVAGSTFPGKDYAWVDVTSDWTPRPWVKSVKGNLAVHNANVAAVGASVCRSGWRTGWRCGTIKARHVTVNYDEGTVYGLTRTSACANHGDSGGPFVSGIGVVRAQGVLSGMVADDADCNADTFFQPVRPILAHYGLNLRVAGGSLPTVTGMFCDYHGDYNWGCNLNYIPLGSAQITWKVDGVARPSWTNQTVVSGSCTSTSTMVSATVTNPAGSWTEPRAILCLGGGFPQ